MHTEVKVGVDKGDSLGYPNLLPEEIDIHLNNNIEKFVTLRLYGENSKPASFEETQKRTDDLGDIIKNSNISTFSVTTDNKPNSSFLTLPADYWHALDGGEECTITYLDCHSQLATKRTPVYPISTSHYNKLIRDPFNKPDQDTIFRLVFGITGTSRRFELITDGVITVNTFHLRYCSKPDEVRYGTTYSTVTTDVNCNLPEHTHKEIIAMTVASILGNIESQRVGLAKQEVKELE